MSLEPRKPREMSYEQVLKACKKAIQSAESENEKYVQFVVNLYVVYKLMKDTRMKKIITLGRLTIDLFPLIFGEE